MSGRQILERPLLSEIWASIGFFTRLPMPSPPTPRPFGQALWAAPVAGAVVGVLVGAAMLLALALGLPPGPAAAVALAVGIAATGGLHEDGAADVADGFGGGGTREDKLLIMRDSRVGSYGALALVLSILGRWTALAVMATTLTSSAILVSTIAAHAASRALLPAFAASVPPARTDGLSAGLGTVEREVALVALALGFLALLPLGPGLTILSVILLAVIFFWLQGLCRRQIGGQTGDVLGALQQASETLLLFIAAAMIT